MGVTFTVYVRTKIKWTESDFPLKDENLAARNKPTIPYVVILFCVIVHIPVYIFKYMLLCIASYVSILCLASLLLRSTLMEEGTKSGEAG